MIKEAVWSQVYGSYVSRTFLPEKERINSPKLIKFDITKCVIVITLFGFYELHLDDKKIKSISFDEYLKYRYYVKEVIEEDYYE